MQLCSPAAHSGSHTLETAEDSGSKNENTVEKLGFLLLQGCKVLGEHTSEITALSDTVD